MTTLGCQQQQPHSPAHARTRQAQVTSRHHHWHATHSNSIYQLASVEAATAADDVDKVETDAVHGDLYSITHLSSSTATFCQQVVLYQLPTVSNYRPGNENALRNHNTIWYFFQQN